MATDDEKRTGKQDESQNAGLLDHVSEEEQDDDFSILTDEQKAELARQRLEEEKERSARLQQEKVNEKEKEKQFLADGLQSDFKQGHRWKPITSQNYHRVEERIRELQRTLPQKSPEKRSQIKPLLSRLQSELQHWKNKNNVNNSKKRLNAEPGRIIPPKPGASKRLRIDESNNNNNNANDHSTESISSRHSVNMARIHDEFEILHARLDSFADQRVNDLARFEQHFDAGTRPPFSPTNERSTFKRVFQRPNLSKFASTFERRDNASNNTSNALLISKSLKSDTSTNAIFTDNNATSSDHPNIELPIRSQFLTLLRNFNASITLFDALLSNLKFNFKANCNFVSLAFFFNSNLLFI